MYNHNVMNLIVVNLEMLYITIEILSVNTWWIVCMLSILVHVGLCMLDFSA